MTNFLRVLTVLLVTVALSFATSSAVAKGPPGHAKGGGQGGISQGGADTDLPAGFTKGKKKGWKGESTPPGWSKGKKKGWGGEKSPPGLKKK